jgi:predicted transcriptional regulator
LDQLATDAEIARSTASEHVSTLAAAGLVRRHRAGRLSQYHLTDVGLALLELMETDAA